MDHPNTPVDAPDHVFHLTCVWDDKGLADSPALSQVVRFMERAVEDGQWVPDSRRGVYQFGEYQAVASRLHERLHCHRERSTPMARRCKSHETPPPASSQTWDVANDLHRCLQPVVGETRAPLGIHFCASHIGSYE
jgi:hypothetical protein